MKLFFYLLAFVFLTVPYLVMYLNNELVFGWVDFVLPSLLIAAICWPDKKEEISSEELLDQ